jgi:hypothetical protein
MHGQQNINIKYSFIKKLEVYTAIDYKLWEELKVGMRYAVRG